MVSDVFADIGDGAVGPDDDLGVFVGVAFGNGLRAGTAHDPAALVLAFGFEVEDAGLLELLEGRIPEMEMEDLALAGQEVVLDAKAEHGFKMAAENGSGDQIGDLSRVIVAFFDKMEGLVAEFLALGVFFGRAFVVPGGGAGVRSQQ